MAYPLSGAGGARGHWSVQPSLPPVIPERCPSKMGRLRDKDTLWANDQLFAVGSFGSRLPVPRTCPAFGAGVLCV